MKKTVLVAGGGLVWNEKNELLMIFRRWKWDLPKGKLDVGETIEACAIREVIEETGLKNIKLQHFIAVTQHEYFDTYRNEEVIKESHWFAMKANSSHSLIPQTTEDITDIKWCNTILIEEHLKNSYPTIIEIIELYFSQGISK